jgi:hypothetical protein
MQAVDGLNELRERKMIERAGARMVAAPTEILNILVSDGFEACKRADDEPA